MECSLRTCPSTATVMPRVVLFGQHAATGLEVPALSDPLPTLAMCGDCAKQFQTVDDLLGEGHLERFGAGFSKVGRVRPHRSELRWIPIPAMRES